MTMITGQLGACAPQREKYVALADESGINATLWFGIASIIVQVDAVGSVALVYDDGKGGPRKSVFCSFMWELALTRELCTTDVDGTMQVDAVPVAE